MAFKSMTDYVLDLNEALLEAKVGDRLRKEMVGQTRAHLEDARDDLVAEGTPQPVAEMRAIESFGSIKSLVKQVRANRSETMRRRATWGKIAVAGVFPVFQYLFSRVSPNSTMNWVSVVLWVLAFIILSVRSRRWRPGWLAAVLVPSMICMAFLNYQENLRFMTPTWIYSKQAESYLDQQHARYSAPKQPLGDLAPVTLPPTNDQLAGFITSHPDGLEVTISDLLGRPTSWQKARVAWLRDYGQLSNYASFFDHEPKLASLRGEVINDSLLVFFVGWGSLAFLDLMMVAGFAFMRRAILREAEFA